MSRASYNNKPSPIAINRINFDIKQINDSKDILDIEGIYFAFDNTADEFNTNYKNLIIGPSDSPYEGGFYLFDGQFPDQYPFHPMTMKTRTQGGSVRKHPNLYTCSKCCFSFLGTWTGPPWTACQNPKTVAASIRSVMTKYPLENEPGWENVKDDRQNIYARLIRFFNLKWAVCEITEKIETNSSFSCFTDDVYRNFLKYYPTYIKSLKEFEKLDGISEKSPTYGFSITYDYSNVKKRLEQLYKQLNKPLHPSMITPSLEKVLPKPVLHNKKHESVDDELVVNNGDEVIVDSELPKQIKIKIPRKAPSEPAKNYELETKKTNDKGDMYIVKQRMRDGKTYKVWSRYKD